ncbi:hypothetical protein [Nostoc commune]|uniref:hypothetical protein n=1 Tax=Nostoc commune TaxID=1178 RepID=UPI0020748B4C|nr:hypothetical protein [Nostoc commune]
MDLQNPIQIQHNLPSVESLIDRHVEPTRFQPNENGQVVVYVHQANDMTISFNI